jgi:Secretion system C-terminal sorting domain
LYDLLKQLGEIMHRFAKILITILAFTLALNAFGQPTIRGGWPQDFGQPTMATFVEPNPLSVGTASDGTRLIATGTNTMIRLFDIDGTLIQSWATTDLVEGTFYLAGGPVIGDMDNDGEVEIVVALRTANARTRSIVALNIDGTLYSTRTYPLENADISSLLLANIDEDEAPETIYYCDDELYAMDNNGEHVPGFPWTISRGHVYSVPVVLPAEISGETAIIVWVSHSNQIHAQAVDATSELAGWPISFSAPSGAAVPAPVIIPTETGWMAAVLSPQGIYVWDQDGVIRTGFPVIPTHTDGTMTCLSVADFDGDNSPDFLFRAWNSDMIQAVNLDGEDITGTPFSTGTGAGRSETISAIKMASDADAMNFCGSLGPGTNDNHLFGYEGSTLMNGFPVDFTTIENVPFAFSAIFPPVNDVMSIVLSTTFGYTTVYDLAVDPQDGATLEWAMPYGESGGNRCYNPILLSSFDGPNFVVAPNSVDFGDVGVNETLTQEFTIQNNGNLSGNVTDITFLGIPQMDLSHDMNFPTSIDPDESASFTLTWIPHIDGVFVGTMSIVHTEDIGGLQTDIPLTCEAFFVPNFIFPDTTIAFGVVNEDDPVGTATFDIQNTSTTDGIISSIDIPTEHAGVISITNSFPLTIDGNSTETITVTWNPTQLGDLATTLTVNHNGTPDGAEQIITVTGSYVSGVEENTLPDQYFLAQNHPNPFNPETSITFGLKEAGYVTLKVFNTNGQEVATLAQGNRARGEYVISFNGHNLASGIYFYVLEANNFRSLKKMLLVR